MMKPEEKAALKTGFTTAVIGGLFATAIANPIAWIAVAYGSYKMGKTAYQTVKKGGTVSSSEEDNLFL